MPKEIGIDVVCLLIIIVVLALQTRPGRMFEEKFIALLPDFLNRPISSESEWGDGDSGGDGGGDGGGGGE